MPTLLGGLLVAALARLVGGPDWASRTAGRWLVTGWMRALAVAVGLRVEVAGRAVPAPALLVGNHVSWLDIAVLGRCGAPGFVAKADLAAWPLLGRLAALAGTLFLRRGSLAAMRRLVGELRQRLADGGRVVVFPEGTSTRGDRVLPFFPALFEAARLADCPIQPFALRYVTPGQDAALAPFVDDDDFLPHLLRLLQAPCTRASLQWLAPLPTAGRDRRALAAAARSAVAQALDGGAVAERITA